MDDRQIVPNMSYHQLTNMKTLYIVTKIPTKILTSFRYWASTNLDIDQPSIVKTFTNIYNINHDIYYEENKSPRSKYMNEFIDLKQLNAKQSKYKHKKTNRTPKMKRVRKKHTMDKKQTVDLETIQKNINLDIPGMNSPTVVETIIQKQMSTGSTDVSP